MCSECQSFLGQTATFSNSLPEGWLLLGVPVIFRSDCDFQPLWALSLWKLGVPVIFRSDCDVSASSTTWTSGLGVPVIFRSDCDRESNSMALSHTYSECQSFLGQTATMTNCVGLGLRHRRPLGVPVIFRSDCDTHKQPAAKITPSECQSFLGQTATFILRFMPESVVTRSASHF